MNLRGFAIEPVAVGLALLLGGCAASAEPSARGDDTSEPTPPAPAAESPGSPTNAGPPETPTPAKVDAVPAHPSGGFVRADGTKLKLNGGDFFFAGANSYSMLFSKSEADEQLKIAGSLGLNAMRFWGFLNGAAPGSADTDAYGRAVLQSAPGVFPEEGWEKLDYVIAQARLRNLKLILPLSNFWDEFGGIAKYLEWAGIPIPAKDAAATCGSDPVGPLRSQFWTNATCKSMFKAYVEHMLNRVNTITWVAYKDEPAIMIWEIINEPRFGGTWQTSPGAEKVVAEWMNEMAHYIKSIDTNHLVATGEEGFLATRNTANRTSYPWTCGVGEGVSYAANAALDGIDVLTIHAWPFQWSIGGEYTDSSPFLVEWIEEHLLTAKSVNKPLYLGEFGWQILRVPGSDVSDRDKLFKTTFDHVAPSEVSGVAYWNMTASHDVAGATYSGPISRRTLTQGISCTDAPIPSDDAFRFEVFCPEDTTTCDLVKGFAGKMVSKVTYPDLPSATPSPHP